LSSVNLLFSSKFYLCFFLSGDEEYREIFNSLMMELVDELEPACQEAGHVFVASVSRLLERLLGQYSITTSWQTVHLPSA
jgi:hypothetical protein